MKRAEINQYLKSKPVQTRCCCPRLQTNKVLTRWIDTQSTISALHVLSFWNASVFGMFHLSECSELEPKYYSFTITGQKNQKNTHLLLISASLMPSKYKKDLFNNTTIFVISNTCNFCTIPERPNLTSHNIQINPDSQLHIWLLSIS